MEASYPPSDQTKRRNRALKEVERGKQCVSRGDINGAKVWFQKSVKTLPTAEGFTYYAWMVSFDGDYDEAISLCKKAIEVDRDFGNPYNDIGAYLMAKGQFDESIAWQERAKVAPRYEPRHFPYTNLGRVYLQKGWLQKARTEFKQALQMIPDSEEVTFMIQSIDRALN